MKPFFDSILHAIISKANRHNKALEMELETHHTINYYINLGLSPKEATAAYDDDSKARVMLNALVEAKYITRKQIKVYVEMLENG